MKNLIFSVVMVGTAIILSATDIYAQQTQTKVGIKAGLSLTTLGSSTYPGLLYDYDFRPGFQGGVFLEMPISKSVLFSPQVLFTQKGGNVNTNVDGIIFKGSSQLNYLDLPFLIGFKAKPNLTFYGGPQVSFLLSEKDILTIGRSTVASAETTGTRKTNLGGNVGAGYKFTSNVSLNINYVVDFNRAFEGAYDGGERNSGFAFTLGYKF